MRDFWRATVCVGLGWLAVTGVVSGWARLAGAQQAPPSGIPTAQRKSGSTFLSKDTLAQQEDLAVNPGMLWVEKGAELWDKVEGTAGKACASCHGAPDKLSGVSARYPLWDTTAQRLHSIETRIQQCRIERQQAAPLAAESDGLLALSALVSHQSRGQAMAPSIDGPARASFEAGRALYYSRFGQLNLSCAQCHEQNWGRRLKTETVSQGQSNGYPLYRLEWQTMGSLHRRLRSCFNSVRSVPPVHGSVEHLALELFLAWRATGLPIETPAIRR